jgi:predicted PurR-regulated permease PerM
MHNVLSKLASNDQIFRLIVLYGLTAYVLLLVFQSLKPILAPFVVGFIIAYIFNKPVTLLTNKGISRAIVSALLVITLVVTMVFTTVIVLPIIETELLDIVARLPQVAQDSVKAFEPLVKKLSVYFPDIQESQIKGQLSHYMGDMLKWTLQGVVGIISNGIILANVLSLAVLTPIITFYFLKDWPNLVSIVSNWINNYWQNIIYKIDDALSAYAHGQIIVCITLMFLYTLLLGIIGLEHAFIVGIITGFFSFIPYLGAMIGMITSFCISIGHFHKPSQYALLVGVFIVIAMIEGQFLTPRLIGKKVGLHPIWIIFALLVGLVSFGFIGVIMALPVATIISVIVRSIASNDRRLEFSPVNN